MESPPKQRQPEEQPVWYYLCDGEPPHWWSWPMDHGTTFVRCTWHALIKRGSNDIGDAVAEPYEP